MLLARPTPHRQRALRVRIDTVRRYVVLLCSILSFRASTRVTEVLAVVLLLPQGTEHPIPVPVGWYSGPGVPDIGDDLTHQLNVSRCPVGSYCEGGVRFPCPGGRYGDETGVSNSSCAGECTAGHYCPDGSSSPTELVCGSATVYCPAGSSRPLVAISGVYTIGQSPETRNATLPCDSGSYCVNGTRSLCPAGRFGCADRLYEAGCNGPCAAGYFCPAGSVSNQQAPCGGENSTVDGAAAVYCPAGSAAPTPASLGHFTVGSDFDRKHVRTGQEMCSNGTFCIDGIQVCFEPRLHPCWLLFAIPHHQFVRYCFRASATVSAWTIRLIAWLAHRPVLRGVCSWVRVSRGQCDRNRKPLSSWVLL